MSSARESRYPVASVEADSPMSGRYRRKLLHLLAKQVSGELAGADFYARGIPVAPDVRQKRIVAELAHEEVEHGSMFAALLEELGSRPEEIPQYRRSLWFFGVGTRLLAPRRKWLDVVMTNLCIDRYAYYLLEDFAESSYAPLVRTAQAILEEEQRHSSLGPELLAAQIERYGRARVQRSLNKWWRVALNFFGPPAGAGGDPYVRLGLIVRDNEERRQAFRRDLEPAITALGLSVPRLYRERFPFL